MKRCTRCSEERASSEFSPDRRARDGFQSRCKTCDRQLKLATYKANPEKMRLRAAEWRKQHPESKRAQDAAYKARHPGRTAAQIRWLKAQPKRVAVIARAGAAVQRAIKRGDLVRPAECELCQVECRPEAAHEDYAHPLDVRWLCKPCHRKSDRHDPKSLREGALC